MSGWLFDLVGPLEPAAFSSREKVLTVEHIKFELCLFNTPRDFNRSMKSLLYIMEGLIQHNCLWLLDHPETPSIYAHPITYKEDIGGEIWRDLASIWKNEGGDCEDLVCARVAEYRNAGINAKPILKKSSLSVAGWKDIYHVLCKLPDGRIEDPSLSLGMSGHAITRQPTFVKEV